MAEANPYAVLAIKDFRFFIAARLLVTLAILVQAVVVGWQVYEITKDPLSLGLIGLAEAIPAITVSLYAGHLADIVERKKILRNPILLLILFHLPASLRLKAQLTSLQNHCGNV